jgi:orotate phosphoribosyltransferase
MSNNLLAAYKVEFLRAIIDAGALKFGRFNLKSGRVSSYFFNAGLLYDARSIKATANAFAHAIIEAKTAEALEFDVLFGPAYKGIPLSVATICALSDLDENKYGNVCYTFDRKEAKDHGEGGSIIGAPLKGKRVLIVDDVVTAGTAKREAIAKIEKEGGIVSGIIVALDRMEKLTSPDGNDDVPMPSAIGEIRKQYKIPVIAVLTIDDIIKGLEGRTSDENIQSIREYRFKYKAID